jgi:hypothetical protein
MSPLEPVAAFSIVMQCSLPVFTAAATSSAANGDSVSNRDTSKDNSLWLNMATQYKVSRDTRKL